MPCSFATTRAFVLLSKAVSQRRVGRTQRVFLSHERFVVRTSRIVNYLRLGRCQIRNLLRLIPTRYHASRVCGIRTACPRRTSTGTAVLINLDRLILLHTLIALRDSQPASRPPTRPSAPAPDRESSSMYSSAWKINLQPVFHPNV